jgi:uncharacterized protein YjbI with pentapeptide repeats
VVPSQGRVELSGSSARPSPTRPDLRPGAIAGSVDDLRAYAELEVMAFAHVDQSGTTLDNLHLDRCTFDDVQLTGAHARECVWRDVRFAEGELSGAMITGATLVRVELVRTRARGLVLAESTLKHLVFAECLLDDASFRSSNVEHTRFERCNLVDADFTGAHLGSVVFDRCDLTHAQFSACTCDGVFLDHCTVEGARSVSGLRGATVTSDQVLPLALSAFAGLGIVVVDDELPAGD